MKKTENYETKGLNGALGLKIECVAKKDKTLNLEDYDKELYIKMLVIDFFDRFNESPVMSAFDKEFTSNPSSEKTTTAFIDLIKAAYIEGVKTAI